MRTGDLNKYKFWCIMHYVNYKVSRIARAVLQRRIYDKQRKDFIIRAENHRLKCREEKLFIGKSKSISPLRTRRSQWLQTE